MKNENNNSWLLSIYSDGSSYFVSNPTPKKGEKVTISVQMKKSSPVKSVMIDGKQNGVGHPRKMKKTSEEI